MGLSDQMLVLMDYWMNRGVSFSIVIRILFLRIPSLIQYFLPISALFSSVILAIRWIRDQELVIYEASGVRLLRLLRPMIIFGLCLSSFQFIIQEYVSPRTHFAAQALFSDILVKEPQLVVTAGQLIRDSKGRTFLSARYDRFLHVYHDILMMDPTHVPILFVVAKEARWISSRLRLDNVNIYGLGANQWVTFQMKMKKLWVPFEGNALQNSPSTRVKTSQEMTLPELKRTINEIKQSGLNPIGLLVDMHLRYSLPFANLVLSLSGAWIVISIVRGNKGFLSWMLMGLMILMICLSYFFLVALCRSLGIGSVIPPLVAAWGPLMIILILSSVIRLIFQR